MNVRIHFFGLVAEAVNSSVHIIEHYEGQTMADLEDDLKAMFPALNRLSYQMALDKKLVDLNTPLMPDNEVAILPPFAGG